MTTTHLCSKCSSPVGPIVALDIDGTMGEYHQQLIDFGTRFWDTSFPPAHGFDGSMELHEYMGLELGDYRKMKLAYRQGGNQRWMPRRYWAQEMVKEMRRLEIEIWITTTRPYERHDGTDPDTREWLARNEIPWDHIIYAEDKYEKFHERVNPNRVLAILDDLPRNLVAAQEHWDMEQLVMIERPHNRKDPLIEEFGSVSGYVVKDLYEFTDLIHAKLQGEVL